MPFCLLGRERVHVHVAGAPALGNSVVVCLLVGHLQENLGKALVGLANAGEILVPGLDFLHHTCWKHSKQDRQLPLEWHSLTPSFLGEGFETALPPGQGTRQLRELLAAGDVHERTRSVEDIRLPDKVEPNRQLPPSLRAVLVLELDELLSVVRGVQQEEVIERVARAFL